MAKEWYDIGNAELYVGKERRYVGVLQGDVRLGVETESQNLGAGIPRRILATAKVSESAVLTCSTPNISPENLAMILGVNLVPVNAGTDSVVDEQVLWDDLNKTIYLLNKKVSNVVVKDAPSTEQIWEFVADGSKGATKGDYTLPYPISAVEDVTSVVVDGIPYTIVGVGFASTANGAKSVEVDPTTGELQFFEGDGTTANPVDISGFVRIIYTPSPSTLVEGTDYVVDYYNGGLIPKTGGALQANKTYFVSYNYETAKGYEFEYGGSPEDAPELELYLVHEGPDGTKKEIWIWKAKVSNGLDYTMAEADWHSLPLEFTILADTTKPKGSQLFKVRITQSA